MPILNNLSLNLNFDEVINYHGLRCRGLVRPRSAELLKLLIDEIHTNSYFNPKIAYQIVPVENVSKGFIHLANQTDIAAPIASHHIRKASHLLFGVCTLGAEISNIISELFHSHKKFNAVLMEELANYALFKLSAKIENQADIHAKEMDLTASGPLNPGDDGFELSSQMNVLKIAEASEIGVNISTTQMMTPQHSISVAYGIGNNMQKWTQSKNCETCSSRERCRHRVAILAMEESKN